MEVKERKDRREAWKKRGREKATKERRNEGRMEW